MTPIIRWFSFSHLKDGKPRLVSEIIAEASNKMENMLQSGPEKSAGLRKLLEAKDCFVRQAIEDVEKGL